MELTLNIYKNNTEIEKTLIANSYDLMFGTVEDILNMIDIDKLNNMQNDTQLLEIAGQNEIQSIMDLIKGSITILKPLLYDVFPELSEDDLKRTKIKELVFVLYEIFMSSMNMLNTVESKKK